jgi:hypothetical protein
MACLEPVFPRSTWQRLMAGELIRWNPTFFKKKTLERFCFFFF